MKNKKSVIEKRRQNLIEILKSQKPYRTEILAEKLNCSPITIRRDVHVLLEDGKVECTRGLVKISSKLQEKKEQDIYERSRQLIAKRAAQMIDDGDIVFMNAGRTTRALLIEANGKSITVITNNLMVLDVPLSPNTSLMLTGGETSPYPGLHGSFVINSLSKVVAQKVFLGVNGITAEYGLTTSISSQTSVMEHMLKSCNGEKIIIADSSKIGKNLSFNAAGLGEVTCLITDNLADPEEINRIRSIGVRVEIVNIEEDE